MQMIPLRLKHWLRKLSHRFEYWTMTLVIPPGRDPTKLIENTDTPDFAGFDHEVAQLQKEWVIYDSEIEALKVRRRALEFMRKHRRPQL